MAHCESVAFWASAGTWGCAASACDTSRTGTSIPCGTPPQSLTSTTGGDDESVTNFAWGLACEGRSCAIGALPFVPPQNDPSPKAKAKLAATASMLPQLGQ